MKRALFVVAVLLLASLPAAAQERGKVGVVMGYPASIGIIWHATDRVAIRPDFNFTHVSSESGSSTSKTSGWGTSFGLGALLYTSHRDNLRTYVSPRFTYARATTNNEGGTSTSEQTSNTYQFSGSFGGEYSLNPRFSVFGEIGLNYAHSESTFESGASTVARGTSTNDMFGTRSAVGVILYFK